MAREQWQARQKTCDLPKRVFQDETGVSTDMIRRYDRASDGVRCRDAAPAGRYRVCDNPPAHKAVEVQAPTVLQHCHALALLHCTGDHWAMAGGFRPAEFREHGANGK